MNTRFRFFFRAWRPLLLILSLGVIAYVLYFHNIRHLVPGYSNREISVYAGASNWHAIVHNPINAPYKLFVLLGVVLGNHSILLTRLVAASFGIVGGLLFFLIVYRWYGFRTAFFGTVMFTTSAGFLHIARLGSAQILQMAVLLFIAAVLGVRRLTSHRLLATYGFIAMLAILCYIPGLIWFELFGLALIWRGAWTWFKQANIIHKCLWPLLFIGLLLPLGYASFKAPGLLQSLIGLPAHLADLKELPGNVGRAILLVGIRSPGNPELFLGHAPLLNIIELALGAMGVYFYARHERSVRTVFLFGSVFMALLLIGLGGAVSLSLLLPYLYLFIACGLNNLLSQWLTVFPRNPIAKYTGVGLVCIMLMFSVLYQVRSYFVAWPHSHATRQTFNRS